MVLRKTVFNELSGFDKNLPSNFNDVEFCLRARDAGLQIVSTPYVDLIHHKLASRGRIWVRQSARSCYIRQITCK